MKLSKIEMKKRRIRNREGKNRNESRGKSNQSSNKGRGTNWEPQTQPASPDEHEQGESNPTGIRAGEWGKNSNAIEQNRPRFLQKWNQNWTRKHQLQEIRNSKLNYSKLTLKAFAKVQTLIWNFWDSNMKLKLTTKLN